MSTEDMQIAIIGISCHFPGSNNVDLFWKNLLDGKLSTKQFPSNFNIGCKYHFGSLDNIDKFDYEKFGFSLGSASKLNPQIRILLTQSYLALCDAGIETREDNANSIGTFISAGNHYHHNNPGSVAYSTETFQYELYNNHDFAANWLAYKLNLQGPSLTVNSTCSSALSNIHTACHSLLAGDCDIALAGAVKVTPKDQREYTCGEGTIFSPSGKCAPFDKTANGTIPGDGVGVVILKPLTEAISDNDYIYATICGSALSNDGKTRSSFTTPNPDGQIRAIKSALEFSDVLPKDITYVEAHGTGTKIGDPIELTALEEVYQSSTEPLNLGSTKANIGHLDNAAGIASFIKSILICHTNIIPPQIHCGNPILSDKSPFKISPAQTVIKTLGDTLVAINSIGAGGSNCHMIVKSHTNNLHKKSIAPQLNPTKIGMFNLAYNNTKTIDVLNELWARTLVGENFDTKTSFEQAGGDSLASLELISTINKKFHLNLPINWLREYPTIHDQAIKIESLKNTDPQIDSSILKLNDAPESAPVLYLIHPGMCGAEAYHGFPDVVNDKVQLYAIDSYNKNNIDNPITEINTLAKYYLDKINSHRDHKNPLLIGGWSLGAIISTAIASIESSIDSLFLIDPIFVNEDITKHYLSVIPKLYQNHCSKLPEKFSRLSRDEMYKLMSIEINLSNQSNIDNILTEKVFIATANHYSDQIDLSDLNQQIIQHNNLIQNTLNTQTNKIVPVECNHYEIINKNNILQLFEKFLTFTQPKETIND